MKKLRIPLYLFVPIIFFTQYASAQNADSTTVIRKSHLKITADFLNDNVYMGRSDSAKITYLTTGLKYIHKSGLFAGISSSYLPDESRIDLLELTGGYLFAKGNWDGEIAANKYFYNANSYNVNAETKGDVSIFSEYDFGFIEPSFTGEIKFSKAVDYLTTFGLEHDFSFCKDQLLVEPAVYMNAATQNYYNAYYEKVKYKTTRKGQVKQTGSITASTLDAGKFKILDYELTVPVEYVQHRFTFGITPSYAIPVNANQVMTTVVTNNATRTRTVTETLSNRLFWELSVSFKL